MAVRQVAACHVVKVPILTKRHRIVRVFVKYLRSTADEYDSSISIQRIGGSACMLFGRVLFEVLGGVHCEMPYVRDNLADIHVAVFCVIRAIQGFSSIFMIRPAAMPSQGILVLLLRRLLPLRQ